MNKIEECVNRIGKFSYAGDADSFMGCLYYNKDGEIELSTRFTSEMYFRYDKREENIVGEVGNIKLTLLHTVIYSSKRYLNIEGVDIIIKPAEVIIGLAYESEVKISIISAEVAQLDYFIPINYNRESLWGGKLPSIELTELPQIEAEDVDGRIAIYSTVNIIEGISFPSFKRINEIIFYFDKPQGVMKGIYKIASCRNLLAFMADYYIEINKFHFVDENGINCSLYFNNNKMQQLTNEPFVVKWSCLKDNFNSVWDKWCNFRNRNDSIINLFYEIVCDNSTRVNLFLNLCQAIEIYSSHTRQTEAKAIQVYYKEKYNDNSKHVVLEHRLFDILQYTGICGNVEDEVIKNIAEKVKNARNYFTHYNERKKEPDYKFICRYGDFLRGVVLMMVYSHVGLLEDGKNSVIKYIFQIKEVINEAQVECINRE